MVSEAIAQLAGSRQSEFVNDCKIGPV